MVEKKRIVGYVRVSTTKQRDEGVSLEAQESKITMYAKMYDLDLVAIEIDVASGKDMSKRPALKRCLALLDSNEADGMLIMKLDRLTRRVKDVCFMVEEYFQDKILISVGDQIDTQTPTGILMLNILTTFAQWERQVLSQRTCEAMGFLKAQGVKLGRLPFGYSHAPKEEDGSELDEHGRRKIVENHNEQLTIKRILQLRKGNLTLQAIADTLTEDGHVTKRGGLWQPCTINQIINRSNKIMDLESSE